MLQNFWHKFMGTDTWHCTSHPISEVLLVLVRGGFTASPRTPPLDKMKAFPFF